MLFIASLFVFAQAATMAERIPGQPDYIGCILLNCGGKATACKFNSGCSKTLSCSSACPVGDLVCSERCVTQFGNDQFDKVSVCLQQNNCIAPYPKNVEYQVPVPSSTASLSDFVGDWYTIAGLDRGLDCYDNQRMTLASAGGNKFIRTATIEFEDRSREIVSTMTQTDSLITNEYTVGGGGSDTVYVIGTTPTLAVAMYLGENYLTKYRGAFVLRKSPGPMTDDEKAQVGEMLASSKSGISVNDLCLLK